jgi:hypothetical protein
MGRPRPSSVELARDRAGDRFACSAAIARKRSLASSRGLLGLRFGLLRREFACELERDDGPDGPPSGGLLMLLARVLGMLGPSRVLPAGVP